MDSDVLWNNDLMWGKFIVIYATVHKCQHTLCCFCIQNNVPINTYSVICIFQNIKIPGDVNFL